MTWNLPAGSLTAIMPLYVMLNLPEDLAPSFVVMSTTPLAPLLP